MAWTGWGRVEPKRTRCWVVVLTGMHVQARVGPCQVGYYPNGWVLVLGPHDGRETAAEKLILLLLSDVPQPF